MSILLGAPGVKARPGDRCNVDSTERGATHGALEIAAKPLGTSANFKPAEGDKYPGVFKKRHPIFSKGATFKTIMV